MVHEKLIGFVYLYRLVPSFTVPYLFLSMLAVSYFP